MKWVELKEIAIKYGWIFVKHGRRHDIYEHPEKDYQIQIERHWSKEIKKGLFFKLKKQIGF